MLTSSGNSSPTNAKIIEVFPTPSIPNQIKKQLINNRIIPSFLVVIITKNRHKMSIYSCVTRVYSYMSLKSTLKVTYHPQPRGFERSLPRRCHLTPFKFQFGTRRLLKTFLKRLFQSLALNKTLCMKKERCHQISKFSDVCEC